MDWEFPSFDKIYMDYLAQLASLDLPHISERLGGIMDGDGVLLPFFGRPHRVSPTGITDPSGNRPSHSVSVVLCKYLLMCPENTQGDTSWVSYKDFKDAAPFAAGFRNNAEIPIERTFSNNIPELEKRCAMFGGNPVNQDFPYHVAMLLPALPMVPLLLLFNGSDEEFPARCSLLVERRADKFLDMECLAIIGWIFSARLCKE